ncbi:MAG: hypothetical protein HC818_01405 [Synechococcaceae cyanobacterium RM1_1_27]|nr:hypothetical protein [Synechococcaceae cyanobacterium SM2_3_2]NJO85500.1 hypothetical protein [Synechococcaceae cyanobacterium RM1_1_27]
MTRLQPPTQIQSLMAGSPASLRADKLGLMLLIILGGNLIYLKTAWGMPPIIDSLTSVLLLQMALASVYFARQPILTKLFPVTDRPLQEIDHEK